MKGHLSRNHRKVSQVLIFSTKKKSLMKYNLFLHLKIQMLFLIIRIERGALGICVSALK